MRFIIHCVIAVSLKAVFCDNGTNEDFYEKRNQLVSHLLSGYNKDMPPLRLKGRRSSISSEPMVVNITLMNATLLSVDALLQSVDMIIQYYMEWNDDRLTWNPSDFDGIEGIYINPNLLWKADIVIFNSRASTEMASGIQHAYVQSKGDITLFVSNTVSYLCLMNVKNFPFDKQVCPVEFASYTFLSHELQLNCNIPEDYIAYSASDNEWIVDDITPEVLISFDSKEELTYRSALLTFRIRRFSLIYVVTIIMPSFVLTFLCVLGMFWSKFDQSDYLAKIGCGLSAILAMCEVLQIAEQSIPKTRELPSLAIYIIVNLLLVALAIIVVVIASKPCRSPRFNLCRLSRRWFRQFDSKLGLESRVICLLVFPVAAVLNLLLLVPKD